MTNIVLDIKEFNPKEAELQKLVASCIEIDQTDLKIVKEKRIELKNARVEITKYGKALREGATKFAKDVIAREKELVAIIEPEEKKLQTIEAEVKLAKEREERKAVLPQRVERLKAIWGEGHNYGVTEEDLLDMDGATFEGLINRLSAEKLEADRAEVARQQAEIDRKAEEQRKEQERLDWEAKAAERAEQARQEERERIEQEQKEKEAQAKADAESKKREEREQREREEKEEADRQAQLEADKRYQDWLAKIGYISGDSDDFHFIKKGTTVTAYKKVGEYK